MNYYESDDKKGKKWGVLAMFLYFCLCVGVMFITYTISLPEPELGILVDFGTGETGRGDTDLANSEVDIRPVTPQSQNLPAEPVLTTEDPDAPAIVREPSPETTPRTPVEETAPVREVNPRAMFPGRTEGSAATSQGDNDGAGNQGSQEGGPDGGDSSGGSGSVGFSLAGRYMVTPITKPEYVGNEQGRVVIRITVDRDGKVTSAVYEQAGSTTNHGDLVREARKAAMKSRFTASDSDIQTGTITYIFKLN